MVAFWYSKSTKMDSVLPLEVIMKKLILAVLSITTLNVGAVPGPSLSIGFGYNDFSATQMSVILKNKADFLTAVGCMTAGTLGIIYIDKMSAFCTDKILPAIKGYGKWHNETEGKTGMALGLGALSLSAYNYVNNQGKSYQNLITALPVGILGGLWLKDALINNFYIMREKAQWQEDNIEDKNQKAFQKLKELERQTNLLWKFWQEKRSDQNFDIKQMTQLLKRELNAAQNANFRIPQQATWWGWACHTEWINWFSMPILHFSSYNRLVDLQIEVLKRCSFTN